MIRYDKVRNSFCVIFVCAGNPSSVGSVNPSPGGGMRGGPGSNQSPAELMAYQEKLRQLSRYIEPLKKAIQANTSGEYKNMKSILRYQNCGAYGYSWGIVKKIAPFGKIKCHL